MKAPRAHTHESVFQPLLSSLGQGLANVFRGGWESKYLEAKEPLLKLFNSINAGGKQSQAIHK